MRISDKTPYLEANGQIGLMGQVQGTLNYGMDWVPQVKAQAAVIDVLNKTLDRNYILLRNFVLPETDIVIPMMLIGPPGIYIINTIHQSGSFSVRDDEWGRLTGETFVPSRNNLIQRLIKLGRVVKVYLNRSGFKGELVVEPILIAPYPATRVETLRQAARVVLGDDIEKFALSLIQTRPVLNTERIADIAVALLKGPQNQEAYMPEHGALASGPVPAGKEIRDVLNPPAPQDQELSGAFSGENLGFSFDEHWADEQTLAGQPASGSQNAAPANPSQNSTAAFAGFDGDFNSLFQNVEPTDNPAAQNTAASQTPATAEAPSDESSQPEAEQTPAPTAKPSFLGLTRGQMLVLGGILVFWLLLVIGFIVFINLT